MSVISIDPCESSTSGACSCCGKPTETVWGYVYVDDGARAIYFCRWAQGHIENGMASALSIGGWGEDSNPAQRQLIGLDCRVLEDGPAFMVINAADSPWGDEEELGTKLSREAALASPLRQECFDILDRIIEDDGRVRDFLSGAEEV
jgi:hypothetical protein